MLEWEGTQWNVFPVPRKITGVGYRNLAAMPYRGDGWRVKMGWTMDPCPAET
jgi:hypothetical protein